MPQMGNMKFPYTKEGIARYKKIKAGVMRPNAGGMVKPSRPGMVKPNRPGKPPVIGIRPLPNRPNQRRPM